jgi:hypothetical protein
MAMQRHWTSGTPPFKILRPSDEDIIASESQYRTVVGMLLYLIKNSRLDLANLVR